MGIEKVYERADEEDSDGTYSPPKTPINDAVPDMSSIAETKKTQTVCSSYKHWDQALVANARESERRESGND